MAIAVQGSLTLEEFLLQDHLLTAFKTARLNPGGEV